MKYLVSRLFLQSSILAENERKRERERELVAFPQLSSCCLVAVYGAVGWFAVNDCVTCISWSDSLFCQFFYIAVKIDHLLCGS